MIVIKKDKERKFFSPPKNPFSVCINERFVRGNEISCMLSARKLRTLPLEGINWMIVVRHTKWLVYNYNHPYVFSTYVCIRRIRYIQSCR